MRKLWNRIWTANPYLVDGIIAGFLAIGSLLSLFVDDAGNPTEGDVLGVLLILVGAGALIWRRHAPIPVLVVVAVAGYLCVARGYAEALELELAVAVWTAATRDEHKRMTWIANAALPVVAIAWIRSDSPSRIGDAVGTVLMVVVVALFGHNVRLRREKRAQEARTEEAEASRAVSDERLRIARELHDVVAHAMSVVVVQAGVAAHVIDEQPAEAKRMLENVRVTSHEALDEMRRLLGVLRGGDVALAPAPGVGEIDALAESLRESGVPVDITVTGVRSDLPGGVDLTAYRIVQEALTNVLKHAGPARVDVHIEYEPGLVTVEVVDDGRGGSLNADGGHGLLGMRERVAAFGGELVTAPRSGGGFRVHATLPYAVAEGSQ